MTDCLKLKEDLDMLYALSKQCLLDFSVEKCSVLSVKLRVESPYYIRSERLSEVSERKKDLRINVSKDQKPIRRITSTIKKANKRLGMTKSCFPNRSPDVIIPFYTALMQPILKYCTQAWSPLPKKASKPSKKHKNDAKSGAIAPIGSQVYRLGVRPST